MDFSSLFSPHLVAGVSSGQLCSGFLMSQELEIPNSGVVYHAAKCWPSFLRESCVGVQKALRQETYNFVYFVVSGSEVAVLKLSHRKFLAPGGLAKIKSQEDVFDVVVYGVTLCVMFLATPRHTALQGMKAQAKVERGALHTHVCCCRPYLPL